VNLQSLASTGWPEIEGMDGLAERGVPAGVSSICKIGPGAGKSSVLSLRAVFRSTLLIAAEKEATVRPPRRLSHRRATF
jgi:hypothetical protein